MAKLPVKINGVKVRESSTPLEYNGGLWHTMVPIDNEDNRVWEWDKKTGRIIQTLP